MLITIFFISRDILIRILVLLLLIKYLILTFSIAAPFYDEDYIRILGNRERYSETFLEFFQNKFILITFDNTILRWKFSQFHFSTFFASLNCRNCQNIFIVL